MKIIDSLVEMRKTSAALRAAGKRIGLVPTMGFLHEGHLSLIDQAKGNCDAVVVSLFVNPLQFGQNEDFEQYPRDLERDAELCESRGVHAIFHPAAEELLPRDRSVIVDELSISGSLCGAFRPGHFRGVLTIVAKLFNIVQPDVAVFGQKDAQQAWLIERMVEELNFPVELLIGPTLREQDGLAMSSRNIYLSDAERKDAACLADALKLAKSLHEGGLRLASSIVARMKERINAIASAKIDYVEVVDRRKFERVEIIQGPVIVLLAVRIGKTRLIDNVFLP